MKEYLKPRVAYFVQFSINKKEKCKLLSKTSLTVLLPLTQFQKHVKPKCEETRVKHHTLFQWHNIPICSLINTI